MKKVETTIKLNKELYNELMYIVHQVKESTGGDFSTNEFIELYESMEAIEEDTRAFDELVWNNYYASEYFEENENDELYELYTSTYSEAIDFIVYWTWKFKDLYKSLTQLEWYNDDWVEYDFDKFTTLD